MADINDNQLIIVMGISGTGKSTLGKRVAEILGCHFVEADDLHDEKSIEQMASGVGMTDEMRQAWVDRLCKHLTALSLQHERIVLAYSGIKFVHRQQTLKLPFSIIRFMLNGDEETIKQRMSERRSHFVNAGFYASQVAQFEPLHRDEHDITHLDSNESLAQLSQRILDSFSVHKPK